MVIVEDAPNSRGRLPTYRDLGTARRQAASRYPLPLRDALVAGLLGSVFRHRPQGSHPRGHCRYRGVSVPSC